MADISNSRLMVLITVSIILGVFFLLLAYGNKRQGLRENLWPSAIATILQSDISTGPIENSGTTVRAAGFNWRLNMNYEFFVNHKRYVSSGIGSQHRDMTIYDGKGSPDKKPPKAISDIYEQYPVGEKVKIFFNPENPNDSFIVKESENGAVIVAVVIGMIFMSIAIISARVIMLR
jgi:Protein of unknown function (DUF3592)